jgi:hypothetical protein
VTGRRHIVGLYGLLSIGTGEVCIKGKEIRAVNGAGSFAAIAAVAEIELLECGLNLKLNGPAQAGAFMSFAHNNGLEGQI